MIASAQVAKFSSALPFWCSLLLVPLVWVTYGLGGWWVLLVPVTTWYLFAALDALTGLNIDNADLETSEDDLQ